MKITMDKQMTTLDQAAPLKNAMKEFKTRYTDGDLKNAVLDAMEELDEAGTMEARNSIWGADILRCDVSAFPTFTTFWCGASFRIEMALEKYDRFVRVSFYVDMDLNVDKRPNLINVKLFKEPVLVTP